MFLGLPFGKEIDMWSMGCVLCQMFTIRPIFYSQSISDTFSRIISILGPLPGEMLNDAKLLHQHFDEKETLQGLAQFLEHDYFQLGLSDACPNKDECLDIMNKFVS